MRYILLALMSLTFASVASAATLASVEMSMSSGSIAMVQEIPSAPIRFLEPPHERVWRVPGLDPCEANPECTHEWALREAERRGIIPSEVGIELHRQVERQTEPTVTFVQTGDFLAFNTAGNSGSGNPRFISNQWVDFSESALVGEGGLIAESWITRHNGFQYELLRVRICGNWVMRINKLLPAAAITPTSVIVPKIIAGIISNGGGFGGGSGGGIGPLIPIYVVTPRDDNEALPPIVEVPNGNNTDDGAVAQVPVPTSLPLLLSAIVLFVATRKRRRQ